MSIGHSPNERGIYHFYFCQLYLLYTMNAITPADTRRADRTTATATMVPELASNIEKENNN